MKTLWMKEGNQCYKLHLQKSGLYYINFNNEMATRKTLLGLVKVKKTVLLSVKILAGVSFAYKLQAGKRSSKYGKPSRQINLSIMSYQVL